MIFLINYLKPKYFAILGIGLLLYVLSWFLWICEIPLNYTEIFTDKKIKIYSYERGVIPNLLIKSDLKDKYYFVSQKIVNFIYRPIECFARSCHYYNCRTYFRDNMETLKKFNDSPNEDKLKIYHKMTFYHNTIFESDNLFKIRRKLYEVDKSLLDYYYSKRNNHEFDLKFDMWYDSYSNFNDYEFHCGKNYNISSTSIYFSYKEFEQGIHEIEEFSRWFNDVNVTVNNPYFDRNFVEKYRELLSTIKE